jgi:hypothetical protein
LIISFVDDAVPTRMNLTVTKTRLKGAQTGEHTLPDSAVKGEMLTVFSRQNRSLAAQEEVGCSQQGASVVLRCCTLRSAVGDDGGACVRRPRHDLTHPFSSLRRSPSLSLFTLTPPRLQRFRTILGKIDEAKRKMGRVMQLAAFSLAEVTYATGDISYMIQESVTEANFRVKAKQENVSGTILPAFEAVRSEGGEGNGNGNGSAFEAFLSLLLRHLPRSGID